MKPSPKFDYQSGNSVQELFKQLPKAKISRLGREIAAQARAYGLTYTDDQGRTTPITLTLRPRVIHRSKKSALWHTIRILDGAFAKIASLYGRPSRCSGLRVKFVPPRIFPTGSVNLSSTFRCGRVPGLYDLFPFSAREYDWISLLQDPSYRPGRIVSRWDANTAFGTQDWKEGSSFFEVNGVGVGGLWYGPACADLTMKTVVPALQKMDPKFRPFPIDDMRRLLLDALLRQRRKIGRTRGVIALFMEKASGSNFVEFERLAKYFQKSGYAAIVAEPTDFVLKKDEIYARGRKIDILYRDTTLEELCKLEAKGHDLSALRRGFQRGQMVSSLEGEFDHKSVFEVFTDAQYSRFFTREEQITFRRCLLWTRLLRETQTKTWEGRAVDLVPFALKYRTQLVLKPNRLYGGQGIVFGQETTQRQWESKVESALGQPGGWVIQQLGALRKKRFYRASQKKLKESDLFVVSGFFGTEKGLGIVGRMSERKIVNVAQRGGLTPILFVT